MMTRPALSTSDREEVEGSRFRRLVSPDESHGRLRSLMGWQSPDVTRDADRDVAISQGFQDEQEVSSGDLIVVDGKLGNFVGQRSKDQTSTPGQQDVNDQHQPCQPRWTMQWEVMRSMLGLRSHAQPDLLHCIRQK